MADRMPMRRKPELQYPYLSMVIAGSRAKSPPLRFWLSAGAGVMFIKERHILNEGCWYES